MESIQDRKKRSKIFYRVLILVIFIGLVALIWSLRVMIVPAIVGGLLAYACLPILEKLKQKGVPNELALLILLSLFIGIITLISNQIRDVIPDDEEKLVLKTRIQYKLNEKYESAVSQNSMLPAEIKDELDSVAKNLNSVLELTPDEQELFEGYYLWQKQSRNADPNLEKYYHYYKENRQLKSLSQENTAAAKDEHISQQKSSEPASGEVHTGIISSVLHTVAVWLIAPFVFIFLLVDDGKIKRNLIAVVPNRYFEMVLTIIDSVDEAIGKYLRGTLTECSLVGASFIICFYLIGFEFQWAFFIGLISGLVNAIPFVGTAIGLTFGLFYALISEEITSILPFVRQDDIVIWVIVVVAIVHLLDNVIFQPVVLGGAVHLHPLVVIFSVMGGSILFGLTGMLFAIPTIVIVKVIFSTLLHELKAYNIIE